MNNILAKMLVLTSLSVVPLTINEIPLLNSSLVVAQTSDSEELKQLDQERKKQQKEIKNKLDQINNLELSPEPKTNQLADVVEETSSNWFLTLMLVGGSAMGGIVSLVLSRILLIQLLVPKDEQERLLTVPPSKQPWWNRPFLGPHSLLALILSNGKSSIPEDAITLHKNYWADLKNTAAIAKSLDLEKFNSQDFLLFLKIRSYFHKNEGNYEGLKPSADLLDVAIKSKNSFLAIDQTELCYQSTKQQEFYQNVADLLSQEWEQEDFKKKVQEQLELLLPDVKSEEGQQALQNYQQELENLSDHKLGLKLLSLFKAYHLNDFSVLNRVSAIIDPLKKAILIDTKELIIPIMKNYDVFEKLAPIIGLPDSKLNPTTLALILQYIALQDRHRDSYQEYSYLVQILQQWKTCSDLVSIVRQQYNPEEYQLPGEFKEPLIGEEIYNKYKPYLD
jgi:hypothetical protein